MTCARPPAEINPPFHSMHFVDKFDISSPRRRLPPDRLQAKNMEQEAQERYSALKIIRRRDVSHPGLAEAFATIYVMLLEDDGRNWEQILWANFPAFMPVFVHERLLEGASNNHGWALENELNTLAIALFWLTSSRERLDEESDENRHAIMTYLAPFALAGFHYPCFTLPEDLFTEPENASTGGVSSYSSHPADRRTKIAIKYFGQSITLRLPPIAPFAILNYFARMEYFHLKVPPSVPLNRQDAIASGKLYGPTREDIENFNTRCATRVAGRRYGDSFDGLLKSRRHDPDWRRSLCGIGSTLSNSPLVYYIPGTFSGRWQGSYMYPYLEEYHSMYHSSEAPSNYPNSLRFPIYVRFREFYCYLPSRPLPVAEYEVSFFNAFLPLRCEWHEDETGVEFIGHDNSFRTRYTPLRRSREESDVSNVGPSDIIITGITEAPYAAAWNGYKYIGRIRPSDGLVVLLRQPLDPQRAELGRALFRGYVISSRNFVGRWRHISSAEQPADWESIFSLCKEIEQL